MRYLWGVILFILAIIFAYKYFLTPKPVPAYEKLPKIAPAEYETYDSGKG